jgi:hypothetical protein
VSWDDEDEHCDSEFVEDINQSVVYECPECKKLMKRTYGFHVLLKSTIKTLKVSPLMYIMIN